MESIQKTHSPIDGELICERPYADLAKVGEAAATASKAQRAWRSVPLVERIQICRRFAELALAKRGELGAEITRQMGRPVRYTPGEVDGMAHRTRTMCDLAATELLDVPLPEIEGFQRWLRREPVGVVFAIAPWNYPYLTAVNTVIPALLSGNAVLLKHSPHTPLCGERMGELLEQAGLPAGVFQSLCLRPEDAEALVAHPDISFVAFTGSVAVGHRVRRAAGEKFIGVGLELGGKDAAYVRADADLAFAVENIVDGACFNSGQSCCAVERVYVHRSLFEEFVERAAALMSSYVLNDPRLTDTTLGPVIHRAAAQNIRSQVADAIAAGARTWVNEDSFAARPSEELYVAPQLLTDVDHSMSLMRDETFGPVVGVMPVDGDDQAIDLINDSTFGLTASVWTEDFDKAADLGDRAQVGTWFMNRCDYLDPMLAWTGVKDSGLGCTLSKFGFDQLTRPKSFHMRTRV